MKSFSSSSVFNYGSMLACLYLLNKFIWLLVSPAGGVSPGPLEIDGSFSATALEPAAVE